LFQNGWKWTQNFSYKFWKPFLELFRKSVNIRMTHQIGSFKDDDSSLFFDNPCLNQNCCFKLSLQVDSDIKLCKESEERQQYLLKGTADDRMVWKVLHMKIVKELKNTGMSFIPAF